MDPSMLDDLEVWGIEPGVTQVFVASNVCDPRAYISDNDTRYGSLVREWKDLYGIPQLESSFGLPKTSSLQGIVNHIQTKNHVSDRLLAFYGTDVQPLKLLNYRGRQKANDEMVKIFKNGGKRYGPHRDHGSDLEVFERQRKADGTLRWRRRQRNQTETPPPSV
ncbi:hypothetical protein DFQ30_009519 [Apophysomyces sp. BC1015]|nr:hypothetical protein DFQ30_009519 [Apophysomyces sp. BC1015]